MRQALARLVGEATRLASARACPRSDGAGAMLEALDKKVSVLLIAVGAEADT